MVSIKMAQLFMSNFLGIKSNPFFRRKSLDEKRSCHFYFDLEKKNHVTKPDRELKMGSNSPWGENGKKKTGIMHSSVRIEW